MALFIGCFNPTEINLSTENVIPMNEITNQYKIILKMKLA